MITESVMSAFRGKLSVLLIESSSSVLDAYRSAFMTIFANAGFDALITPVISSPDDALFSDENLFSNVYFDVVISDVSLGKREDQLGLEALNQIRERFPDIFTIAYTGQDISYNACSNNFQFDFFIAKQRIEVPGYQAYAASMLRSMIRINPYAFLASDPPEFWSDIESGELLDLNRILRRVTYTGPDGAEGTHISGVRLRRVEGGYSGAVVLYVDAQSDRGMNCMHAILKVARKRDVSAAVSIRHEVGNYAGLVRWYLPYSWRPELLGHSEGGHLEALCYSFISSGERPLQTLRQLVSGEQFEAVDRAVTRLFDPSSKRWYDRRNVVLEPSIQKYYLGRCFETSVNSDRTKAFRRALKKYDQSSDDFIAVGPHQIGYPERVLFGRPSGSYQSCLVHGDLNTSNVLVSPDPDSSDVTLIDFSATGRGHVFFDFIVFEINLRLDCPTAGALDVERRIDSERLINAMQPAEVPGAPQILRIRQTARENFPEERELNYLYGLAAFSFSLMNAPNLDEASRQVLAACISACQLDLEAGRFWDLPARSVPLPGAAR